MHYSIVITHVAFVEFLPNLDTAELEEVLLKYPEAEFAIFPAEAEISIKEFDNLCDADKFRMPELFKDFPPIFSSQNETSDLRAGTTT